MVQSLKFLFALCWYFEINGQEAVYPFEIKDTLAMWAHASTHTHTFTCKGQLGCRGACRWRTMFRPAEGPWTDETGGWKGRGEMNQRSQRSRCSVLRSATVVETQIFRPPSKALDDFFGSVACFFSSLFCILVGFSLNTLSATSIRGQRD